MTAHSLFFLVAYTVVLIAAGYPLGLYMAKVANAGPIRRLGWLYRLEQLIYRVAGIDPASSMNWSTYALAMLAFNAVGTMFAYVVQRMQQWLPFNPQGFPNISPDSSFNTAISFASNTSWQGYVGETTMSYVTQMLAINGQEFLSAATGVAVGYAVIRGFAARSAAVIGNFWIDLVRATLYVLVPLAAVLAVFLMSEGVIQNFHSYKDVKLIDPVTYQQPRLGPDGQAIKDAKGRPVMATLIAKNQTLAMGPVAAEESIKLLSSDGGGFFNANSAHPYENPTPLTNFVEMLAILIIPAAFCFTFGRMVGDMRQGWTVLGAMTVLFVAASLVALHAEQQTNPTIAALGVDQNVSALQAGGNMEGKETRFGVSGSALFSTVTTSASSGAVNAMHDSFMPMGGLMPLALIESAEVVFGGVGSGLCGMLVFALLATFVAGLMIGRTPEYLGKKILAFDMKMIALIILITPMLTLVGTMVAVMTEAGRAGILNPGPHGFSEVLYAYSSTANNNGSAFAGLSANTPFYNVSLGIMMWFGRFAVMVPVLALAGSFAAKTSKAEAEGVIATHGLLFVALLVAAVALVGVLNYIPALALGPVVEHLQLFH